jgi:hypothetical protein
MKTLTEPGFRLPLRPLRGERGGVRWDVVVDIYEPLTPALSPLSGARELMERKMADGSNNLPSSIFHPRLD